ncbi:MAG TPA: 3-mercaptopyruvate sulfurtransferase [Candidatus Eremiobacteraceae bacterium]
MSTNEDPLVSTDWLVGHLADPHVRVIDASFKMPGATPRPSEEYLKSHIPGAAFFDVDAVSDHGSPLPHMYPAAEQFARDVAALGISDDDLVVVYDSGSWLAAPRAWWMFLSFGHDKAAVLDGGLKKWVLEGRPTESGIVRAQPGRFAAAFDGAFVRNRQQVLANIDSRAEQVLDARARDRFEGTAAEPWPGRRSGHIRGSRNVPYGDLIEPATGAMKPLSDLRRSFSGAGVDLERPIVTMCGSGVSASVLTFALYRLGVRGSALYDGSWAEWGLPDGPPIVVGPA